MAHFICAEWYLSSLCSFFFNFCFSNILWFSHGHSQYNQPLETLHVTFCGGAFLSLLFLPVRTCDLSRFLYSLSASPLFPINVLPLVCAFALASSHHSHRRQPQAPHSHRPHRPHHHPHGGLLIVLFIILKEDSSSSYS